MERVVYTYLCLMPADIRDEEINNIVNYVCMLIYKSNNCTEEEKFRINLEFRQFIDKNGEILLPIKELRYIYNIIGIDDVIDAGLPALLCHYNILHKKK